MSFTINRRFYCHLLPKTNKKMPLGSQAGMSNPKGTGVPDLLERGAQLAWFVPPLLFSLALGMVCLWGPPDPWNQPPCLDVLSWVCPSCNPSSRFWTGVSLPILQKDFNAPIRLHLGKLAVGLLGAGQTELYPPPKLDSLSFCPRAMPDLSSCQDK